MYLLISLKNAFIYFEFLSQWHNYTAWPSWQNISTAKGRFCRQKKFVFSHFDSSIISNDVPASWLMFNTQCQFRFTFCFMHFDPHLDIDATFFKCFGLFFEVYTLRSVRRKSLWSSYVQNFFRCFLQLWNFVQLNNYFINC